MENPSSERVAFGMERHQTITRIAGFVSELDLTLSEPYRKTLIALPASYEEDSHNVEFWSIADSFPLLTPDQEKSLFERVQNGYEQGRHASSIEDLSPAQKQACTDMVVARQEILLSNLRLVCSIARNHTIDPTRKSKLPLPDIMHDGSIGLIDAANRFNVATGRKFSTVATRWIAGAISRANADKSRIVRVPEETLREWSGIDATAEAFRAMHYRDPSAQELAQFGGLQAEKALAYYRFRQQVTTFGEIPLDLMNEETVTIWPGSNAHVSALVAHDKIQNLLLNSGLSPLEILVISLRFGATDLLPQDFQAERKNGAHVDHRPLVFEQGVTGEFPKKSLLQSLGTTQKMLSQIARDGLAKMKAQATESSLS